MEHLEEKHRLSHNKNSLESRLNEIRILIEAKRKILNGLVDGALEKGIALGNHEQIMEHSRKLDELVEEHVKFKEKHKCYFKYMLVESLCI